MTSTPSTPSVVSLVGPTFLGAGVSILVGAQLGLSHPALWVAVAVTVAAGWRLHRTVVSLHAASAGLDIALRYFAEGRIRAGADALRGSVRLSEDGEQSLRRLVTRAEELHRAAGQQRDVLEKMAQALTAMGESVTQQVHSVDDVRAVAEDTRKFDQRIVESIDRLSRNAEESSSSILEMVAINNEVRENIHNFALSVQETTTAIEEMTFSSREVAKNIEELSTAAEETAASMNEMDVSISQVETNANETSGISETVSRDAEIGVSAINQTIDGIDKIKDSSRIAADVIGNLGAKINEIGNILNVIDDVAEQTNLLALNAAIIAAQAGEHGRGFAVVADEIKALAERTGASTKEIAELIKAVQDESKNAIAVMSRGVEDVQEGVRLGHNAEDALRKIVDSAKRSTLMIQAIAQATVEQAKGSKQVTNSISRIAETVQQIALATAEQARGSEQIMKSAERMKLITDQVERSADEQNRGGRQITEAIENIREMAEQIQRVQQDQEKHSERLSEFVRTAVETSNRSSDVIKDMERMIGTIHAQLQTLTQFVRD